jgi:predicted lipid-binding transport protein (Tim44 family)
MNDTSQFLDIVIFAMIAVFLGLRLRSVLGRRNPDQEPISAAPVTLDRPSAPLVDQSSDPLTQIRNAEPSFHPDQFLGGARMAFELIVKAFAAGDLTTLRPLLSESVFADFKRAIETRGPGRDDQPMELVRIVSATLGDASFARGLAEISVRFVSEQRGPDGQETRLIDLWRFARQLGSSDPNWRLVATGSLDA